MVNVAGCNDCNGSAAWLIQSGGVWSPSGLGWGIALMIFSIWLIVDVPGKRALPSSISPRMQPRLHMSTPLVYLVTRCGTLVWTAAVPHSGIIWWSNPPKSSNLTNAFLSRCWQEDPWNVSRYLVDPSKISGALYHLVATYSVNAGFPLSSWIWLSDRARPKSHIFTMQSVFNNTLDGWKEIRKHRWPLDCWGGHLHF